MSFVHKAFELMGLTKPKSPVIFHKVGLKRFSSQFANVMSLIEQRASGSSISPYDAKNASLALSLYVGSYFNYSQWEKTFEWLERENIGSPERIIDLGCECGATTCLLAFLFPNAEIIGIDSNSSAIKCANELVSLTGQKNIKFVLGNAEDILRNEGIFDLIFSSFFTHEWLSVDDIQPLTTKVAQSDDPKLTAEVQNQLIQKINSITAALSNNGIFVSVDRIPHIAGLQWYVGACEQAGLRLSIPKSYKIETDDPAGKESFPVNVFEVERGANSSVTSDEILSLFSFLDMKPLDVSEVIAEVYFEAFAKENTLFDSRIRYKDGSGNRSIKIIKSGPLLLRYDWTDQGYRQLITLPLVSLVEVLNRCQEEMSELEEVAYVDYELTKSATLILQKWGFQVDDV